MKVGPSLKVMRDLISHSFPHPFLSGMERLRTEGENLVGTVLRVPPCSSANFLNPVPLSFVYLKSLVC